jgi:hypothetical protein
MILNANIQSTPLIPATVLGDPRIRSCSTPYTIFMGDPSLNVIAQVHGLAVTLHLDLISAESTVADLTAKHQPLRAFVQIDKQGVLVSLPAGGGTTISMGNFARGSHIMRYGVFIAGRFLNGRVRCFEIP